MSFKREKSKIFIAGASGMVGSAIIRNLAKKGYANLVGSTHSRVLAEQKDLPLKTGSHRPQKPGSSDSIF